MIFQDISVTVNKLKEEHETGNSKKKANGDIFWNLDKTCLLFLTICEYKGKIRIDIRKYYEKDLQTLPGKTGISLIVAQWIKLVEYVEEVNKEL